MFSFLTALIKRKRLQPTLLEKIDAYYCGNEGYMIVKEAREIQGLDPLAFVYGEVNAHSFSKLLAMISPKSGDIFYDLGAGAGKACAVAQLLYPELEVRGVEYLLEMQNLSARLFDDFVKVEAINSKQPKFMQGDLFEYDFSDAHIIFINATGFFESNYLRMIESLKQVRTGTQLIVSSKKLPESDFMLQESLYNVAMSWGTCQVSIYERR